MVRWPYAAVAGVAVVAFVRCGADRSVWIGKRTIGVTGGR